MGIGLKGTLPWPSLKSEIAYFARVTRRVPPGGRDINALIMGRRTWDSIPERFRPLVGRINVVLSRTPEKLNLSGGMKQAEPPIAASSIREALDVLRERYPSDSSQTEGSEGKDQSEADADSQPATAPLALSRVFIIGGAEIYASALKMPESERVLLTRVINDFECDTFFPLKLGKESQTDDSGATWVRRSKTELDSWTGETVPEGIRKEKDVEWEFQMYEKETPKGA